MNKITKSILLITILLVSFVAKIEIADASRLTKVKTNYYFDFGSGDLRHSYHWHTYTIDGEVAYCIEPYESEGTDYVEIPINLSGLSEDIKDRVLLIGYYGYTYKGHQTQAYRAATQALIWDTVIGGGNNTVFSSGRYSTGTIFNISNEKAEIERLISQHYIKPSFADTTLSVQVGETITLTDTNNVLSNFDVSINGADYSINNNQITLTPTSDTNVSIKMNKKIDYSSNYKIFSADGYQKLMVAGNVDPILAIVNVNASYGSVELIKKDSETGSTAQGQATLERAEYGVFTTDGELVTTMITDSTGYAKSDSVLEYGSYYVQEIKPSKGYYIDSSRYYINTEENANVRLNVKEKVIKNYISILKQYEYVDGDTKFLNAESGIKFDIFYPDGRKWDTITTDKNGYASLTIPYGVWRFHQVNTNTGFEKIYDFYITVDENSSLQQYYNVLNNKISAYLQVLKVDSETGKTIAIADTTFKILNTDTNQFVSQYVAGKVISDFKTDEEGKFITPLKLEAGNYKLIEVTSPHNYLLDSDGMTFTIGSDTHYNYTNYGTFITIKFKNQVIKGQVEIHKSGEEVKIKNGQFYYEEKPLENVTYQIYADEDVLSSDKKTIHFRKGELVDTIVTNNKGYAISKKLYLGKYFLVEVATNEDYILDTKEYHFTLTQKDNVTPIVYKSYSALNFLKKGNLEFTKTDLVNGEPISDTIIEVYTEDDDLIFTGKTDDNGKVVIDDLFVGKFYIVEKEASTGYVITEEKVYFEIKENGEIVKAEMTNKPIMGELEFTKTDISTGELLPKTLIEIYNAETEELVFSGRTDENGKIIIPEIRYGKYYILEKEAPIGYVLNEEKMYFEITEDGQVIKSTMTNEKIKSIIKIHKVDNNDNPLVGVGIGIFDLDGNLIGTYTTNELGEVEVELEYGKYYYQELNTLDGYILNDEKVYFEVTENGKVIEYKLINIKVPNTELNDCRFIEIISALLILCGMGVIIYVYTKKEK